MELIRTTWLLMIIGMCHIIAVWVVMLLALHGIGRLTRRLLLIPEERTAEAVLDTPWIGLAALLAFLQIWHVALPVNAACLAVVLAVGLTAAFAGGRQGVFVLHPSRYWPVYVGGSLLAACWLANRAMGPVHDFDTGFYHLTAIRWTHTYSLVPGLANLNDRLGFNNASFLYLALFHWVPGVSAPHHVATGTILLPFALQVALSVSRLCVPNPRGGLHDWMRVLMIPPLVRTCYVSSNSTSPDTMVFFMGAVLYVTFIRTAQEMHDARVARVGMALLGLLGAAAVAVKMMCAALVGFLWLVFGILLWRVQGGAAARDLRPQAIRVFAGILLLMVPWVLRGYVLTGYPLYPSSVGGLPVWWRVPEEAVEALWRFARDWSRVPWADETLLNSWLWLLPWGWKTLHRTFDVVLPALVGAVGTVIALQGRGVARQERWATGLYVMPAAGALVFWFLTAPYPRYAGAAFWCAAATGGALAARRCGLLHSRVASRSLVGVLMLYTAACVAYAKEFRYGRSGHGYVWVRPGRESGFHPLPAPDLTLAYSSSGLSVHVPRQGLQCWDAPLPCAPRQPQGLALRSPPDIASGFWIDPAVDRDQASTGSGSAPTGVEAAGEHNSLPTTIKHSGPTGVGVD